MRQDKILARWLDVNTLIGGWWVRKTFREEFNGYWMCYVGSAGAGVGCVHVLDVPNERQGNKWERK